MRIEVKSSFGEKEEYDFLIWSGLLMDLERVSSSFDDDEQVRFFIIAEIK